MIPNALANTGPYADLWGHLKSIEHALSRVLDDSRGGGFVPASLDRDRLRALLSLLQDASDEANKAALPKSGSSLGFRACRSDFSSALNLWNAIESNRTFDEWQRTSRKGSKTALDKLVRALDAYLVSDSNKLFPKAPKREFEILRAILQSLVADAEIAIQS